jgi:hypothetical protein
MWNIEILEEKKEFPQYHSSFVGYIAMDLIMRDLDGPEKIFSDKGSMEIIGSIRRLAREHRMEPRLTWRDIDHGRRWSSEVALSTAEDLEVMRSKRVIPWLNQKKKEMQLDLILGTCRKLNYSRWYHESGWLKLDEHKFDKGQYLSEDNLKELIEGRMLCGRQLGSSSGGTEGRSGE